jgi:hypothetical protein
MRPTRYTCLTALLVIAITTAQAQTLCHVSYRTTSGLQASLKRDQDCKVSDSTGMTTIFCERTLWWFPKTGEPAYPAAVCQQQFTRANGGYARLPVQADCRGTLRTTCAALAHNLSKAKW